MRKLLLAEDVGRLPHILTEIQKAGVFSYDCETNSKPDKIDVLNDKIIGVSVAYNTGLGIVSYYLPIEHYDRVTVPKPLVMTKKGDRPIKNQPKPDYRYDLVPNLIPDYYVIGFIQDLISNPNLKCYVHNLKFEKNISRKYGFEFKCKVFDIFLADYVMQPDRRHGLKVQAADHLGVDMIQTKDVMTFQGKKIQMCHHPLAEVAEYAADDAYQTLQLGMWHEKRKWYKEEQAVYDMEMELLPVLADMEYTGVHINTEHLNEASIVYQEKIQKIQSEVYRLAGCEFNINSDQQVADVLYNKLELECLKKTPKGADSTAAKVLKKMVKKHPIIQQILDYNSVFKIWSTYCDTLPHKVNPLSDRVHTSFNQCVTETGRLSSSKPNLQNIPREDTCIKKGFVPRAGWVFVVLDYSQIELRMLTHLSKDPVLLDAYRRSLDVHTITASKAYKVALDKVTKEQRQKAKIINFGIIYGMTKFGLADNLGVSVFQAQKFIDNYLEGYPAVLSFADKCIAYGYKHGYVKTLMGRRRYLPIDDNMQVWELNCSERQMVNTVVQGSSADLIKLAMIDVAAGLAQYKGRCNLLLQVHDELVIECEPSIAKEVAEIARKAMELNQPLCIPLVAEPHIGYTWLEAKDGNKELEKELGL